MGILMLYIIISMDIRNKAENKEEKEKKKRIYMEVNCY